jgi:hypothetical protein
VGDSIDTKQAERVQMVEAGCVEGHYRHDIWHYHELFMMLALRAEYGVHVAVRFMVLVGMKAAEHLQGDEV